MLEISLYGIACICLGYYIHWRLEKERRKRINRIARKQGFNHIIE